MGICHSYTLDGHCISLLKLLFTNYCIFDCKYCVNRVSSDIERARFRVDEVVNLTLDFYRHNYIEGLFLSSGIILNSDYTMQQLTAVAKNILNRQFTAGAPNRIWLTDITYLWTAEGWLYIAAVLDSFSLRIVGWAMAEHLRETLVNDALQMALGRRQPSGGLLHHSDRGIQYASAHYQALLKAQGIIVSMSRKGNCWDNSVMERFWGGLKSEQTNDKLYFTRATAKQDVIDYIEMFYNCKRLNSTLVHVSPMQFEREFLLKNVSILT